MSTPNMSARTDDAPMPDDQIETKRETKRELAAALNRGRSE